MPAAITPTMRRDRNRRAAAQEGRVVIDAEGNMHGCPRPKAPIADPDNNIVGWSDRPRHYRAKYAEEALRDSMQRFEP